MDERAHDSVIGEGTTAYGKFDFRLPHLHLSDPTTSGSGTNEPLVDGFFGLLRFEEWKDFEQEMDSTLKAIPNMPSVPLMDAQKRFDQCRERVNKTYDSQGLESQEMSDSFPVCFAKTPLYLDHDPRKRFDTETSVDAVGDLFTGLTDLLDSIFDGNHFDICTKQLYLLGVPRISRPRRPIPDRPLCTMTMSTPDSPPVCTFEMKGPKESFAHFVKGCCEQMVEVSPLCSEDRRNSIVREVYGGPTVSMNYQLQHCVFTSTVSLVEGKVTLRMLWLSPRR